MKPVTMSIIDPRKKGWLSQKFELAICSKVTLSTELREIDLKKKTVNVLTLFDEYRPSLITALKDTSVFCKTFLTEFVHIQPI